MGFQLRVAEPLAEWPDAFAAGLRPKQIHTDGKTYAQRIAASRSFRVQLNRAPLRQSDALAILERVVDQEDAFRDALGVFCEIARFIESPLAAPIDLDETIVRLENALDAQESEICRQHRLISGEACLMGAVQLFGIEEGISRVKLIHALDLHERPRPRKLWRTCVS